MCAEAGRVRDTIPILITIDCEPDARETTPGFAVPWAGFERCFEAMSERREVIAARTGAPAQFCWLWRSDPQIALTYGNADWAFRTYARQIAQLRADGDEFGLHVHVWRWDSGQLRWISDCADDAWVEGCVRGGVAEYERQMGEPPRVFSMGSGWHNQASVRLIERLGVKIDLSLEPGCELDSLGPGEIGTGVMPNRMSMPDVPYRPLASDFLKPGGEGHDGIWLIPMSTGPDPQLETREGLFRKRIKQVIAKINLGYEPYRFMPMFEGAVSRGERPYVAIATRTDIGSNEGLLRYAEQNIDWMLNHRLADRFAFVGPSEALTLLTRRD
jgi:hypothetical protein